MSKIIEFRAENIKRLSAVHIKPDGALVVIGGQNEQGKSSVLDSIMYALAGAKTLPDVPIRRGQNKGRVKLDLGNLIVERTFSQKGSTLEVRSKAGVAQTSPQKILDDLCGKMAFDPLEFSRQKPKDQLAIMRDLVGIDFTALDEKRAAAFATRTSVNRDVKNLEGELAGAEYYPNAPGAEVSAAELADKLDEIREANAANDRRRQAVDNRAAEIQIESDMLIDEEGKIEQLAAELESRRGRLVARRSELRIATEALSAAEQAAGRLVDIDASPVREQIARAETVNRQVRANANRLRIEAKLELVRKRADALTNEIEVIDAEKQTTISMAKFPIAGLGFGDDGITLDGLPFEQASSAQRLRVSVAMGLAANPDLRVMLIRDGSLLDASSLAMIAEMADAADAQIWCERVSEGAEVSVVIEDGAVKVAEAEAVESAVAQ